MKTYKFTIKGYVQGVCYRKSIYDNARKQNIQGSVKNLENGDVEAVVNLDANNFNEFVSILKKGSSFSNVTSVTSTLTDFRVFKDFSILY